MQACSGEGFALLCIHYIAAVHAYLLGASGEVLDRNRAPPHTANRTSRITMTQPSTAPTTVTVVIMFVSLMVVGVSKSSDLIEAHLISVVPIVPVSRTYLADTQQS